METLKDYYATAQFFCCNNRNSETVPSMHRYLVLKGFDEETLKLVTETTLTGEWTLLCGQKAQLDFFRSSVSNGRELSEFTEYTGQVYKRTPPKKTFVITREEFRAIHCAKKTMKPAEIGVSGHEYFSEGITPRYSSICRV